jgi:hypothetical protein
VSRDRLRHVLITCDAPGCRRGIIHHLKASAKKALVSSWPDPGPGCKGLGGVTIQRLAIVCDVHPKTLLEFLRGKRKTKPETAQKILDGALKMMGVETRKSQADLFPGKPIAAP